MPFNDPKSHLQDMRESIGEIEDFIAGMDFNAYRHDHKTKSAVERQMQIVTEAAFRLGNDAESVCPGPDWKGLRGLGNLLRHAYHRIDDEKMWDAITNDLPLLKAAVLRSLTQLNDIPPAT